MSGLAIKILWGIAGKLVTETFASRFLVHGLRQIAKSTSNDLDDKWVNDLSDALGVEK